MPRNTVEHVAARLRDRLKKQGRRPQERIETERVLAAALECSRETLRRALDRLEKEGLIWRHVGQGTFMGPRPAQKYIRPEVLFEMASPADLMEARLVIEPSIAATAAVIATPGELLVLRDLALRSRDATDWREYERIDDAFHKAVATATANRLLMAVLGMLSSVRGRSHWQRQHDAVFRQARRREYALQQGSMHLAIVDAIKARDGEGARNAMREHLRSIQSMVAPR